MKQILLVLLTGAALAAPVSAQTPPPTPAAPAPAALSAGGLKINLAHLDSLLVKTIVNGRQVTGTAVYAEPDPKKAGAFALRDAAGEGFLDLDDVARAVIVYLRHAELTSDASSVAKAHGLLDFVLAVQAPDGTFYNFVDAAGRVNTLGTTSHAGLTFWAARAAWALAEGVNAFSKPDPAYAAKLNAALDRVLNAFDADAKAKAGQFRTLDGVKLPAWLPGDGSDVASYVMLACAALEPTRPSERNRRLLAALADGLRAATPGDATRFPFGLTLPNTLDPWEWHAWGARQVQALAAAYHVLKRPEDLSAAKAEAATGLAWLALGRGPYAGLRPAPRQFPQIAYGMEAIASSLYALSDASGEPGWADLASVSVNWLSGLNDPNVPMYDPTSGVTFDGLERKVVNLNSGAESNISALLALLEAAAHPNSARLIPAGGWRLGPSLLDQNLSGPEGRDFGAPPETTPDARSTSGSLAVMTPGAALTFVLPAAPAPWRLLVSERSNPAGGVYTLTAGRQALGRVDATASGNPRLVMQPAGVTPISASGPQNIIVSYDGPVNGGLDTLLALPGLQSRVLGSGKGRLETFKSWLDAPQALPALPADAASTRTLVFNAAGERQTDAGNLPALGFALREYTTGAPLPQATSRPGAGGTVTLTAGGSNGKASFINLAPAYNGDAFSTPNSPTRGNLDNHDGPRGATFPADRGPAAGSLLKTTAGSFTFPPTNDARNMITSLGQTLNLPAGRYASASLLLTAEQGNVSAPLTIIYADGSSDTRTLSAPDWCQAPRPGDTLAFSYLYRRNAVGSLENKACNLYALNVPLDATRTLSALRLPDRETLHLFALTLTTP